MTDPIRQQQLGELELVELCTTILSASRNELYVNMRYFDIALSSFGFEADWSRAGIATDGFLICYGPESLLHLYR